jgi:hypothetical protein
MWGQRGVRLLVVFGMLALCLALIGIAVAQQTRPEATPGPAEQRPTPTNDERRVARASDVFVGRVVSRVSGIVLLERRPPFAPDDPQPVYATIYAVEVEEGLRGTATGTVLVRQDADFDRRSTPRGDGPSLLNPGEEAIFVASLEVDTGWYALTEGRYGHVRIGDGRRRTDVVARFEELVAQTATPVASPSVGGFREVEAAWSNR